MQQKLPPEQRQSCFMNLRDLMTLAVASPRLYNKAHLMLVRYKISSAHSPHEHVKPFVATRAHRFRIFQTDRVNNYQQVRVMCRGQLTPIANADVWDPL